MLVICNGMPRSGSTLQYNLAAEALEAQGPTIRVGFLDQLRNRKTLRRIEAMRDSDMVYIMKTHDALLEPEFYTDRVKLLFTHRDRRDVAASLRKKTNKNIEEILRDLCHAEALHVQVAAVEGALIQPYKLLYEEMHNCLAQIIVHLSIHLTEEDRERILARNSLESMIGRIVTHNRKPIVAVFGMFLKRLRINSFTQLHPDHISETKGLDGDWINQFDENELFLLNPYVKCPSSNEQITR